MNKTILIFSAPWCVACKALISVIGGLGLKVPVQVLDVDQNEAAAQRFGVQNLPTVVFMADGQAQYMVVGNRQDTILRIIEFAR